MLIMRTPTKKGRFYVSVIFKDSYLLLHLNKPGWPTARHCGFYWDCPMALGEIFNIHLHATSPRLPSTLTLYTVVLTQKLEVSSSFFVNQHE